MSAAAPAHLDDLAQVQAVRLALRLDTLTAVVTHRYSRHCAHRTPERTAIAAALLDCAAQIDALEARLAQALPEGDFRAARDAMCARSAGTLLTIQLGGAVQRAESAAGLRRLNGLDGAVTADDQTVRQGVQPVHGAGTAHQFDDGAAADVIDAGRVGGADQGVNRTACGPADIGGGVGHDEFPSKVLQPGGEGESSARETAPTADRNGEAV